MVSTKESRSSVNFDEDVDKEYHEYAPGSNEPPPFNVEFDYYDDYSTGPQLPLYAPEDNELSPFAATRAGDDSSLFTGIGSSFGADPRISPPIPGFEPVAASPFGLAPGAGYDQSFHANRSRDTYRTLLGIPDESGQDGYHPHSSDSSYYHGSSSNLGHGGAMQDLDYLTTLSPNSIAHSSGFGSKGRRPRKPPTGPRSTNAPTLTARGPSTSPRGSGGTRRPSTQIRTPHATLANATTKPPSRATTGDTLTAEAPTVVGVAMTLGARSGANVAAQALATWPT
ncbi:uncharacterized protein PG986_004490 [Apiospora aurea]|uniref:Uncharacterized protein n=1 Tax=Apiospora aurea TaxID=335848 RepID=A0ABR1QN44_9PEZI